MKSSPASEEESRRKAEFDAAMVMIRHHVKFPSGNGAAIYFYRELMRETRYLERHHGFGAKLKVLPEG